MSDLAFDYSRFWFIPLPDADSKTPEKAWGGYSQDYREAEHVYTHDETEMLPGENWGICGIQDREKASFSLLVFDIDIHKAPDGFDPDRVTIPQDTLVTRSQNGGFHVYFQINGGERGDLQESDFETTVPLPFDIDIRGSAVSHHVVAPSDIPGFGGKYDVVCDSSIKPVADPSDAASFIQLDGNALLEFSPDTGVGDFDWDAPEDPPEEMPTCYFRGLELRKAAPDDHPNTHKVNLLTAMCGLAAGYSPEEVADHFTGEWAPRDGGVDRTDREKTEYQVQHIADQYDRDMYSPPAESTLADYGIFEHGEECSESCPIDYHGPREEAGLDIVDKRDDAADEAAAVAGADGGAQTDTAPADGSRSKHERFREDVTSAIAEAQDDVIPAKTCRHRIATALVEHYDFVYPEAEVRGWRSALYVYDDDEGIYEPRGEAFIERMLERHAGDYVTNQIRSEIVAKVKRMSIERGDAFETEPHRLVVGNGILDLHVGELEPYDPREYHRTKIGVDWNPDTADPDAIDDFLHDIVRGKDVDTLYRLIAHSLYKEYVTEKAAMLVGNGQNGKSVFLDLVEAFLGQYNVSHRSLQELGEKQYAANQLQGKLANIHPDMGDSAVKEMATFKKLTGRDTMTADVKYESPIQFENFATLMFAANEMPVFNEDNHAVWRRWVYVDFPYTFDARDPDAKDPEPKRELMRRLTDPRELEALLVRCQQEIQQWYGGRDWFASAMRPDEVREKMKKAAEPVFNFASACLEAGGEDDYVPKKLVRKAYQAYATEEDLPKLPENQFGERLTSIRDLQIESGQAREDGQRVRVYKGIQLSSRGIQLLGGEDAGDGQSTVDDVDDSRKTVRDQLVEMFEANDHDPVPKDGLVWSVAAELGPTTAKRRVEKMIEDGEILETGSGLAPV